MKLNRTPCLCSVPLSSLTVRTALATHIVFACIALSACGGGETSHNASADAETSLGADGSTANQTANNASIGAGDEQEQTGAATDHPDFPAANAASMADLIMGDAGVGVEFAAEDMTAPVLSEAQAGESQVQTVGADVGDTAEAMTSGAGNAACDIVPAIPAVPAGAKKVTAFGAVPDDGKDDAAAIQAAFDSLKSGEWLVFPPGKYLHSKSIRLRAANTTLYGKGAMLHATNPDSLALTISADHSRVYSFTLTAVTNSRKSSQQHARISVFKDDNTGVRLTTHHVTIQGNSIVNAGPAGSPEANSASSAGILLSMTDGFLVAQNTVARSLADGIHMTAGTKNGRVLKNTVRETGDDMIAIVSYVQTGNPALNTAAGLRETLANPVNLNRNILVAGNHVSGNYWGRGITVAGADGVTVRGNTVERVPSTAGILLARAHDYRTFGVNNVIVENNIVQKIQNTVPVYNPGNKFNGTTSDHGTIEIHNSLFLDEAADPIIRDGLSVKNVVLRNNTLKDSKPGGVRTGVFNSGKMSAVDPRTGGTVYRSYTAGDVKMASLLDNKMSQVRYGFNLLAPSTIVPTLSCSNNVLNGTAIVTTACNAPVPAVTGAKMSCSAGGNRIP